MPAPRGMFAALSCLLVLVAAAAPSASVAWPASSSLLVAEVMTGGASASDEYVEIANAGSGAADLAGLEVVYASASGATVTRKALFSSTLLLEPNRHLLIANAAGIYAAAADVTYTNGLAADGGSIALRRVGGSVVDSMGWGTASGAFVEGLPAPAPPARSSIERLPGGAGGNLIDTNEGSADWIVQPNPVPQSLGCDPIPAPTPTPSPTPTATAAFTETAAPSSPPTPVSTVAPTEDPATPRPRPTPTPTPTPSPAPATVEPTLEQSVPPTPTATPISSPSEASTPTSAATATVDPTEGPSATNAPTAGSTPEETAGPTLDSQPTCSFEPTPEPTSDPTATPAPPTETPTVGPTAAPSPTAVPTPTGATPSPGATATAIPTARPTSTSSPTPSKAPEPIAVSLALARAASVGARVHVAGVVTAAPGFVGESPLFALGDGTAGIYVRISPVPAGLERGRAVDVVGTLAAPYGQLEIRDVTRLTPGALASEPEVSRIDLSAVGESTEGLLVNVRGRVASTSMSSGRLMFEIADGPAVVRVYASALTGLSRTDVKTDALVAVTGIVGQRSSGKGRLDGYRVWLRSRADYVVRPDIEPERTPASSPTAPNGTGTPTPSPAATPTPAPHHELAAVLGTRGAAVDVEAVVTATAGLLRIDGPTIVVDDGTASAAVVLPDGAASPATGAEVRLIGTVGRWQSGPIVRATSIQPLGSSVDPEAQALNAAPDAGVEWRLVRVYGPVDKAVHAGVRWRIELLVAGQRVVVLGEPQAGALVADPVGRMATVTGIVRRSTSDSTAFQVLPRGPSDLRFGPAVHSATPKPSPKHSQPAATSTRNGSDGNSSGVDADRLTPLSELAAHRGERVTVSGVVTDAVGTEITIDDGTATARVGGDDAADQLELLRSGDAVQIGGAVSEDDLGLLLVADPDAVIVLPGTTGAGTNGGPAVLGAGASSGSASGRPTSGQSLARNPILGGVATSSGAPDSSSALRSSAATEPVDLVTFLLVLLLALGALGTVAVAGVLTRPARVRNRVRPTSEGDQAAI